MQALWKVYLYKNQWYEINNLQWRDIIRSILDKGTFLHSHVFYFFGKFYKLLTVLILMLLDQCALENESNEISLAEDNWPGSL